MNQRSVCSYAGGVYESMIEKEGVARGLWKESNQGWGDEGLES
jgi:hypothetical protein